MRTATAATGYQGSTMAFQRVFILHDLVLSPIDLATDPEVSHSPIPRTGLNILTSMAWPLPHAFQLEVGCVLCLVDISHSSE